MNAVGGHNINVTKNVKQSFFAMAIATAVITFAAPARAEVITLACSKLDPAVIDITYDIDIANQTVSYRDAYSSGTFYQARVTDRYVSSPAVHINLRTGIVSWPDGTGTCRRVSGKDDMRR